MHILWLQEIFLEKMRSNNIQDFRQQSRYPRNHITVSLGVLRARSNDPNAVCKRAKLPNFVQGQCAWQMLHVNHAKSRHRADQPLRRARTVSGHGIKGAGIEKAAMLTRKLLRVYPVHGAAGPGVKPRHAIRLSIDDAQLHHLVQPRMNKRLYPRPRGGEETGSFRPRSDERGQHQQPLRKERRQQHTSALSSDAIRSAVQSPEACNDSTQVLAVLFRPPGPLRLLTADMRALQVQQFALYVESLRRPIAHHCQHFRQGRIVSVAVHEEGLEQRRQEPLRPTPIANHHNCHVSMRRLLRVAVFFLYPWYNVPAGTAPLLICAPAACTPPGCGPRCVAAHLLDVAPTGAVVRRCHLHCAERPRGIGAA